MPSQGLSQVHSVLTPRGIAENTDKLSAIFPDLTEKFFKVLCDRLRHYGVSDREFEIATDHIIDTCAFKPKVADIILFIRPEGTPTPIQRTSEEEARMKAWQEEEERKDEEKCAAFRKLLMEMPDEEEEYNKPPKGF